jgi:phage shock protein A
MPRNQIERLKNDSRELDQYIHRLKRKGRDNLAHKLSAKKLYLNQTIAEYEKSTHVLA